MGIAVSFQSYSQSYFNEYDSLSIYLSDIHPTDSGYVALGFGYNTSGTGTIIFKKYDHFGLPIEADTFSSDGVITGSGHITPTYANKFYMFYTIEDQLPYNGNSRDLMFTKLDYSFDTLFTTRFGGNSEELSIDMIESGNHFFLLGTTFSQGNGGGDFYLVKMDTTGVILWEKTYGTSNDEAAISIDKTLDGKFILSGISYNSTSLWDNYIIKIDTNGNVIWDKTFGTPDNDYAGIMTVLNDHSFLVGSNKGDYPPNKVAQLYKLSGDGEIMWTKSFPYNDYSAFYFAEPVQLTDATLLITNNVKNTQGYIVNRTLKLDPMGDIIWSKLYYTRDDFPNYIYDVKNLPGEGYLMCGSGFPPDTSIQNSWIVKMNCNGEEDLMYPVSTPCDPYDCSQFPIDASFTASETTVDLAMGGTVTFTNNSANTTSRVWAFGDSTMDYTDAVMPHTFTDTGWFNVSLIVFHGMCSDTMSIPIHVINTLGIPEKEDDNNPILIYPNPSSGEFTIKFNKPISGKCVIINVLGEITQEFYLQKNQLVYPTLVLKKGVYLVRVQDEFGSLWTEKLIVN